VKCYIYFPLLPRALDFRQFRLLWDNHRKTSSDAAHFQMLLNLCNEKFQEGLVLEIICRRTYSTNLLKTYSLCCNQICGVMSTVLWDVTPCSLVDFCQCVFLIIFLFRLLSVDVCVHINSVLETNISLPALVIIKHCPFDNAIIRKIEGSSLEFFIDIFLPVLLMPWDRLSL